MLQLTNIEKTVIFNIIIYILNIYLINMYLNVNIIYHLLTKYYLYIFKINDN